MRCKGCFKRFKNRPGLWKHLSQAHHIPCQAIYLNNVSYLPSGSDGDRRPHAADSAVPETTNPLNSRKYPYFQGYIFYQC